MTCRPASVSSRSAIPIALDGRPPPAYQEHLGKNLRFYRGDLTDYDFVLNAYESFRSEALVFLGEMSKTSRSIEAVSIA